jgi:hypothetical protein
MTNKPILCLDFDGVLHSYTSGWQGIDTVSDPPVDGAIEFLYEAIAEFDVCIYSTRNSSPEGIDAMRNWLGHWESVYWMDHPSLPRPRTALVLCVSFPNSKPSAFIGIDDRMLTFTGVFPAIETLKNFKPWNKN